MRPRLEPVLLVLALGCGCGHAPASVPAEQDPTLARAETVHAAQHAPDLWARAEDADALAAQSSGEDARGDYRTEARLWRQAAIAEAERIETERQRASVEAVIDQKSADLTLLQGQREAVHARAERLAAGRTALEQAQRMLELAATDHRRRPKLTPEELRAGAQALIDRAQLVRAAALAMGASDASLAEATRHLERAQALLAKQPDAALREADVALFDAHAALGPLRQGTHDPAAAQSLTDALRAAGFAVLRSERGLAARIMGDPSKSSLLTPRHAQRLCKLAQGFPEGSVQLTWREPQPANARSKLGAARRLLQQSGCKGERFDWQTSRSGDAATGLEVVWLAY